MTAARYAIYFAPWPRSEWAGLEQALEGDARRYGLHATLKAPFCLANGTSPDALLRSLEAWACGLEPIALPPLRIERLGDFLALVPSAPVERLDALAAQCVRRFDAFRAPPDAAELARRRRKPLTPRQEALLSRWGYPYVMEEFRFHLSLTGTVPPEHRLQLELPREPLSVDHLCVFVEPAPGEPFRVLHRAPFRRGRLVYVAGPSGAGKDTVLRWARHHLRGGAPVLFARRTITRPHDAGGERHESVTREAFEALRRSGAFAMAWQANGHAYGIRSEIRDWLARGLTVVVNGSREYLPQARREFPRLEVVHVTAPDERLRERLAARGREAERAIVERLARAELWRPPRDRIDMELVNDGAPEQAGRAFLDYLLSAPR